MKVRFTSLLRENKDYSRLAGYRGAKELLDNFDYSGDWFADLDKMYDVLVDYYRNQIGIYNNSVEGFIWTAIRDALISYYPENKEEIKAEIFFA